MNPWLSRWAGLIGSVGLFILLATAPAAAYRVERAPRDAGGLSDARYVDCVLSAYNWCSGWIWTFSEDPGGIWGVVYDSNNCPGGCNNGGAMTEVYLYSRCTSVPGSLGGVGVYTVDWQDCLVDVLYTSGPLTMTHCVSGDRWTTLDVRWVHVFGHPFAITVTWGPDNNPQLATDNAVANFYCARGYAGFPGCATTGRTCVGWNNLPQRSYIYFTDLDNNGTLEDMCALYGAPYGPSFPYIYYYGYMNNNLVMAVGLDCSSPTAVEPTSWGHVKALFE